MNYLNDINRKDETIIIILLIKNGDINSNIVVFAFANYNRLYFIISLNLDV